MLYFLSWSLVGLGVVATSVGMWVAGSLRVGVGTWVAGSLWFVGEMEDLSSFSAWSTFWVMIESISTYRRSNFSSRFSILSFKTDCCEETSALRGASELETMFEIWEDRRASMTARELWSRSVSIGDSKALLGAFEFFEFFLTMELAGDFLTFVAAASIIGF